ncbi:hypothetical protein M8845_15700, partial [Gelidibacter japonicus]|uniref:hypothetical protein n=1 Tax=Gelidibacter japonicus TaxID=1962232 RepID=UPI0020228F5F
MKKHYTYLLQFVLLMFITPFGSYAENSSIIDSNNELYQLKWTFIKTLIDEDLEKTFEKRDGGHHSNYEDNLLAPPCLDITISLNASGSISITPEDLYSIKDNTLTITATETNFTCDHIGVNPVTLTITDAGNNISTCTAIVTVEDSLAPILADLPTDQLNIPM